MSQEEYGSFDKSRRSYEISKSLEAISKELQSRTPDVEDFQFKPLTTGLGFKKKTITTDSKLQTNSPLLGEVNFSETRLEIVEPVAPVKPPTSEKVDEIFKNLKSRRGLNFEETIKFPEPPKKTPSSQPQFFTSSFDFSAGLLDTLLTISMCLFGLISLITITQVDLFEILMTESTRAGGLFILGLVLAGFSFMYLVTTRVFLGATIGEWLFEQQLGSLEQKNQATYSLKVALRSLLVIGSGFLLFPILSIMANSDLAGKLTGISLLRRR